MCSSMWSRMNEGIPGLLYNLLYDLMQMKTPCRAFLFLLFLCLAASLSAQVDTVPVPDSLLRNFLFRPQQIIAYRWSNEVDSSLFRRGDDHSIEYGLSTVPGLRYESRGPGGSRRVSIRGSLMRSGFGVRGIKAYLDGVPLTGPDGNTPLEVLDVAAIQQTQVLRGPQCALYGAGTGGVLLFESAPPDQIGRYGGNIALGGGSFGYQRASIGLGAIAPYGKHKASVLYVRERFAGYRALEGNHKDFVLFKAQKNIKIGPEIATLSGSAWYYDGGWELPGSLDSATNADAPRSANLYSLDSAHAAVQRKWLQTNLRFIGTFGKYNMRSSIYGQWTHKLNPYGTNAFNNGYKDETGTGWGTRTTFWRTNTNLNRYYYLHIEAQIEPSRLLEYENIQGQPGPIKIDQRVLAFQGLTSFSLNQRIGQFSFLPIVGINHLITRFEDRLLGTPDIPIATPLMPQASLQAFWLIPRRNDFDRLHRSIMQLEMRVASSYSPPSWWELRRADGSIDEQLLSEQGVNFEAVFERRPVRSNLELLEVRLYHHRLFRAILPYTDTLGQTAYRNAEDCGQTGAEVKVEHHIGESMKVHASAAWMHYRFLATSATGDFERGDAVPGIPSYTGYLGADYRLPFGLVIRLSGQLTGPIWLDSHNNDRQDAYFLLNAFLEQTFIRRRNGVMEKQAAVRLTFGCNNLLNAAYSNYLSLNDRRRNYWNPAPGRNIFAAVQFTF